jgi:hypothetical protein
VVNLKLDFAFKLLQNTQDHDNLFIPILLSKQFGQKSRIDENRAISQNCLKPEDKFEGFTLLHKGKHPRNIFLINNIHESTIGDDSKAKLEEIREHQFDVLKKLKDLKLKDIFTEADGFTKIHSNQVNKNMKILIRDTFEDFELRDKPSIEQDNLLKQLSAAEIYMVLSDDVTVHSAYPDEENHLKVLKAFQDANSQEDFDKATFELRENIMISQIKNQQATTGKGSVLIYGVSHENNWMKRLTNEYDPSIYTALANKAWDRVEVSPERKDNPQ